MSLKDVYQVPRSSSNSRLQPTEHINYFVDIVLELSRSRNKTDRGHRRKEVITYIDGRQTSSLNVSRELHPNLDLSVPVSSQNVKSPASKQLL